MVLMLVEVEHDVFAAAAARARAGRGVKMAGRAAAATTDSTIALRLPAAVEATDAAAAATAWSVMVDFGRYLGTHFATSNEAGVTKLRLAVVRA